MKEEQFKTKTIAFRGWKAFIVILLLILSVLMLTSCGSDELSKCHVEGCNNKHTTGYDSSLYCSYHKCEMVTCGRLKMEGSKYCDSHTCHKPECFNKVSNVNRNYCIDHVCRHTGCDNPVISGSRYCDEHTCTYPGCTNEVYMKGQKCSEHSDKTSNTDKTTNSKKSGSSKKKKTSERKEYEDAEELFEDNPDEFDDLDEAEEYWEEEYGD